MNTNITLTHIAKLKAEKKEEIRLQQAIIANSAKELFAPTPTLGTSGSLMKTFNTGMAVFDGVMMGLKVMRMVKKFFKR